METLLRNFTSYETDLIFPSLKISLSTIFELQIQIYLTDITIYIQNDFTKIYQNQKLIIFFNIINPKKNSTIIIKLIVRKINNFESSS